MTATAAEMFPQQKKKKDHDPKNKKNSSVNVPSPQTQKDANRISYVLFFLSLLSHLSMSQIEALYVCVCLNNLRYNESSPT